MRTQLGKTPYLENVGSTAAGRVPEAGSVGKRTLVESLDYTPVQRKVAAPDGSGAPDAHAAAACGVASPPPPRGDRLERLFGPAPIQRKADSEAQAVGEPPPASGGGAAIPDAARQRMERSFGADFSTVRIHEGPEAAAMGAVAYARGEDIHFQPGRYDPVSPAGLELLGHELTHVVQQRSGRVARPQGKDSPVVPDPALEAEADAAGARAARGEAAGVGGGGGRAAADGPVQRYTDVTLDKQPWRLSQHEHILAPAKDSKAANKELYADPGEVAKASAALAQSNIALNTIDAPPETAEAARAVGKLKLHRVVAMFKPRNEGRNPSTKLQQLQHENDQMGTLQTFADCNETARLIMGSDYRGEGMEAPVTNTAPSGGERMHERQEDNAYGKEFSGMGGHVTEIEARGLTAIVESLIAYRDQRLPALLEDEALGPTVPTAMKLLAKLSPRAPTPAWGALHELKTQCPGLYRNFAAYAGIDSEALPKVGDALVTFRSTDATGRALTKSDRLYAKLLKKASAHQLAQIGITADTPFAEVEEILNQHGDPQLSKVLAKNSLWNKHWAGVILTDGVDYATLENDASTEASSLKTDKNDLSANSTKGMINQQWWFNLYGADGEKGHSFHDQEMATEDFGNVATTLRFRRPPPPQKINVKALIMAELQRRFTPELFAAINPNRPNDVAPLTDELKGWAKDNNVSEVQLGRLMSTVIAELKELAKQQPQPIMLDLPEPPTVSENAPKQPSHQHQPDEQSGSEEDQDDRWFWERHPYLTAAAGGLIVGGLLALVSKLRK